MNKRLLGIVILIAGYACGQTLGPGDPIDGTYVYRGLDDGQNLLLQGQIVITTGAPDGTGGIPFSGTWEINEVILQTATATGPQVGVGTVTGWVTDGVIFANMNPGTADNNVMLSGNVNGIRFGGRWSYATFVGVISSGPFELERVVN